MVRRFYIGEGGNDETTKGREVQKADLVVSIREGDENSASKVREIQKADLVEEGGDDEKAATKVREIQKADLVVSINISIRAGDEHAATKVREIQKADLVEIAEHDDDISIREGGDEKAATKVREIEKKADYDRRPVDFCEKSQRWRDARGRYCRPPSPASFAARLFVASLTLPTYF